MSKIMKMVRYFSVAALASLIAHSVWADGTPILSDNLIWLPIGDSITEGETWMGHADQGDVNSRGGYRYQLWREMEEVAGQPTVSVGYRSGHQGTVEPDDCHWAWHAAQYGGVIMHDNNGSHGAAAMCVESTLEVAGYPDVITVLIGVNDLSFTNGSDDQVGKVFETWKNMIVKYSQLRPKSTICVSTILPAGGSRGYIDKFNTLVRAAATAKTAPFNCANVVLADMHHDAFDETYDAQYFKGDNLHPNENGAKLIGAAFAEYLKAAATTRANNPAELVSIDNGTAGFVTVRFNKAIKSVTSATLTITGTDIAGNAVNLVLENGALAAENSRLVKFATEGTLQGGTYTATIALEGTDGNDIALPETLALNDSKFVEILGTGAEANVPATLRAGFTKHGTLTMSDGTITDGIGSGDNFGANGPGEQFAKVNDLPPYVKRVGYYMELKRPGQPAQFVWASMDATTGFLSYSSRVGIPTEASGNVKAIVDNLQVYGNRGNFTNSTVTDGVSSDQGIVEFTPWDWSATDQTGFPPDFNANGWGWNDTLNKSTLKGCMQIAKVLRTTGCDNYTNPGAEMLFAYNGFNRAQTTDIAIGSFSTHRQNNGNTCTVVQDWGDFVSLTGYKKFAANAYEVKKLEIWTEEGEAPSVLYIPEDATVTVNSENPLTKPVTGEGRLVLENYMPTDQAILDSLQDEENWTGTVEIRNYAPTANYGIIYFQNYANANSTVALNGVTATMYTGKGSHPDQSFGALEIMDGGWTTGTGDFTVSPLYNCNLKGSGTIAINHRGQSGIVNFCGDHSGFTGAINFATNADKGVVLAPAGTGRTSGVAAKTINVLAGATVGLSGTTNGTLTGAGTVIFDGAMPSTAIQNNLKATAWTGTAWLKNLTNDANRNPSLLGNSGSTVRYTNVSGWMNSGAYDPTVDIVNDANGNGFTFTNGSSGWETGKIVKFARLTGTGTLKLNWGKTFPLHLPDVSGFTGTINCANANGIGVVIGAEATIGQNGNGKIVLLEGAEAKIGTAATWSAPNGIVVNGTLKFTGGSNPNACYSNGALSGSGAIDLSETTSASSSQLRELFKATEHTFTGNIKTKVGTHFVFAAANASSTAMSFSSSGFICLEGATTATFGDGATWDSTGLYLGDGTTLKANGGTLTGRLYALNTTLNIGTYEKPVITTTEFQMSNTSKRMALVFPETAPTARLVKLIAWTSHPNTSSTTFTGTVPEGYSLDVRDDGLYLVGPAPSLPEWINDQSEEQVAAYNTWAEAKGVTDSTAAKQAAFAFNCANDDEAIAAEEEAFVITSITIVDGVVTVTAKTTNTAGETFNITPVIKGSATVNGTYELEQDDAAARFFKAFIEL